MRDAKAALTSREARKAPSTFDGLDRGQRQFRGDVARDAAESKHPQVHGLAVSPELFELSTGVVHRTQLQGAPGDSVRDRG